MTALRTTTPREGSRWFGCAVQSICNGLMATVLCLDGHRGRRAA